MCLRYFTVIDDYGDGVNYGNYRPRTQLRRNYGVFSYGKLHAVFFLVAFGRYCSVQEVYFILVNSVLELFSDPSRRYVAPRKFFRRSPERY